jgi:solute carrier family 25 phosphate transporter 23/24/25/41
MPAAQSLLAGGIAGIISRTTVAPLERVKILFQVQALSAQGAPLKHTSVWRSLVDMYRAGGIIGMWKGNTANCVRVFPSSALQFAAYSEIKRVAFNDDPTTAQRLVAGGSAGAIACFVTYPLDFIRGRLTTDMAGRYSSVGGALADVVRNEGFFALYRGLLPSIIGIVPYVGVDFAVTIRSGYICPRTKPATRTSGASSLPAPLPGWSARPPRTRSIRFAASCKCKTSR